YQNQLILSGKINDVGAYNRINVPVSYRTGVELAGSVTITTYLQWSGNLTLSENKIKKFTEYVDDWDWGGQWSQEHRNSNLAFSPAVIASSQLRVLPFKNIYMDLMSKYVSDQYLDNTQNNGRKLDAFFVNNLLFSYSKSFSKGIKNLRLGLMCNNLFNEKYEPNGYTYSGISGGVRSDYNYYFPQAGRNYLMQVTLGF
ncbi:MAG: TonB-dependent receptor, partial [Bacteroidia bacterium]|nr:TonB-dependent receptor [Bacteroidia bacterium]